MFKSFAPPRGGMAQEPEKPAAELASDADGMDDLRRQMKDMQERLERMSKDPPKAE